MRHATLTLTRDGGAAVELSVVRMSMICSADFVSEPRAFPRFGWFARTDVLGNFGHSEAKEVANTREGVNRGVTGHRSSIIDHPPVTVGNGPLLRFLSPLLSLSYSVYPLDLFSQ